MTVAAGVSTVIASLRGPIAITVFDIDRSRTVAAATRVASARQEAATSTGARNAPFILDLGPRANMRRLGLTVLDDKIVEIDAIVGAERVRRIVCAVLD